MLGRSGVARVGEARGCVGRRKGNIVHGTAATLTAQKQACLCSCCFGYCGRPRVSDNERWPHMAHASRPKLMSRVWPGVARSRWTERQREVATIVHMERARLPRPERCGRGFLPTPSPPCKRLEAMLRLKGNDIGLAHVFTVRSSCVYSFRQTESKDKVCRG
jgi:hypothetical protein